MKLIDFLTNQANKAGITLDAASIANIPDFDVPDTVAKGIDNSLISIVDAKNNHSEIKNHYHKQNLDTIDKLLKAAEARNPELAEDDEWKGERSTFKRIEILDTKLAALAAKKAGADGGKDKKEIQKEIDALQAQLKTLTDARAADKAAHDAAFNDYKLETELGMTLGKFTTIHDELDLKTRNKILKTLIEDELQDKQVKFAFDDSGRLTILKNDGNTYYGENHQQIKTETFIEKTLAEKKQLKLNGQTAAPGANNGQQQQSTTKQVDAGAKNANASLIAANERALEAFNKGTAQNAAMMG